MKNFTDNLTKNTTAERTPRAVMALLCSLLCCLLALHALATDAAAEQPLSYVTDTASILSAEEVASLEKTAEQITTSYGCGVYIVTVDDYTNYTDSGSVEACAEEIWNYYSLGYGEGANGIILLLSMEQRDYDLVAHGDIANTAFTDYGKEMLADDYFLSDFAENDWYTGFENYLAGCSSLLASAAAGTPVDVYNTPAAPPPLWAGFVVSLLIGLIIALIVCMIIRGSMKSVHQQTQAGNYILQNGINFSCRQDFFTHSTEVRVYDPPQKSNDSGGGTSVNSGGFSHSSGKF